MTAISVTLAVRTRRQLPSVQRQTLEVQREDRTDGSAKHASVRHDDGLGEVALRERLSTECGINPGDEANGLNANGGGRAVARIATAHPSHGYVHLRNQLLRDPEQHDGRCDRKPSPSMDGSPADCSPARSR